MVPVADREAQSVRASNWSMRTVCPDWASLARTSRRAVWMRSSFSAAPVMSRSCPVIVAVTASIWPSFRVPLMSAESCPLVCNATPASSNTAARESSFRSFTSTTTSPLVPLRVHPLSLAGVTVAAARTVASFPASAITMVTSTWEAWPGDRILTWLARWVTSTVLPLRSVNWRLPSLMAKSPSTVRPAVFAEEGGDVVATRATAAGCFRKSISILGLSIVVLPRASVPPNRAPRWGWLSMPPMLTWVQPVLSRKLKSEIRTPLSQPTVSSPMAAVPPVERPILVWTRRRNPSEDR